jgi:hypothetical protein
MHLIVSAFTFTPSYLLAFFVILYDIYIFVQYINIVSIDQELICLIQILSFLIFLDLPSKEKLKSNDDKASLRFRPFQIENA